MIDSMHRVSIVACILGLTMITGCSKNEPSDSGASGNAKVVTAASQEDALAQAVAAANAGSVVPKYDATLVEGINFAKPGAPQFILDMSGISGAEDWGRWTDAKLGAAKLRFREPLPPRFTLHLKVRDFFGLNAGQKALVRVGAKQQEFTVAAQEYQTVDLAFDGVDADSIEINVPKVTEPNASDSRKIGLGLVSLSLSE